jgi:hypothetical protein
MVAVGAGAAKAHVAELAQAVVDEAVTDSPARNAAVIHNCSLLLWRAVVQPSLDTGDWGVLLPALATVADGVVRCGGSREWAAQLSVTAAKAKAETGDADAARATLAAVRHALVDPNDRDTVARHQLAFGLEVGGIAETGNPGIDARAELWRLRERGARCDVATLDAVRAVQQRLVATGIVQGDHTDSGSSEIVRLDVLAALREAGSLLVDIADSDTLGGASNSANVDVGGAALRTRALGLASECAALCAGATGADLAKVSGELLRVEIELTVTDRSVSCAVCCVSALWRWWRLFHQH